MRPLHPTRLLAAAALLSATALTPPAAPAQQAPKARTKVDAAPAEGDAKAPVAVPVSLAFQAGKRGLSVEPDQGEIVLRAGHTRQPLPLTALEGAEGRVVTLAGGKQVGIVEAHGGTQRVAAIVAPRGGGLRVVWHGALDARGDPGERHGHLIEVADRTGDGVDDVIVGVFHERTRVCGQERTLLSPRAVDPKRLELSPVVLNRVTAHGEVAELQASPESPGPTARPLLAGSLRLSAVSSQPGGEPPWLSTPPRALTDGDPATAWFEARGGGGRGEFASLRFEGARYPIRALAFTLAGDKSASGATLTAPRSLLLVGDAGAQLRVRFPDGAAPGVRQWVEPAAPLPWRCLSVVIEESVSTSRRAYAALAEVEAYTSLDFGEGIESVVATLAGGDAEARGSVALLTSVGEPAVAPLRSAVSTLPPAGRRRAVHVFANLSASVPAAPDALADAAGDADAQVADEAVAALLEAGTEGAQRLLPGIAGQGTRADRLALTLARRMPDQARPELLKALAAKGGAERPVLRQALGMACDGKQPALTQIDAWSKQPSTGLPARAAAALALAGGPLATGCRALALGMVERDAPSTDDFVERWRLVQATRTLGTSDAVDAWLVGLAANEERWMLRDAALTALHERGATAASDAARKALADEYPRVRVTAAGILTGNADAFERLKKHVQRDRWAMVRAAALTSIAKHPKAPDVLRGGIGDRSARVRAAAVEAMTTAQLRDAWPSVRERLTDDGELPEVVTAGVRFARALCIAEAGDPLLAILRRGLDPAAWAPDAEVALVALEALAALGEEHASTAIALAGNPAAPSGFQEAAKRAKAQPASCGKQ